MRCDVCGIKINYSNKTDDNLNLCDDCIDTKLEYCIFCGRSTISYNVANGLRCGSCKNNE